MITCDKCIVTPACKSFCDPAKIFFNKVKCTIIIIAFLINAYFITLLIKWGLGYTTSPIFFLILSYSLLVTASSISLGISEGEFLIPFIFSILLPILLVLLLSVLLTYPLIKLIARKKFKLAKSNDLELNF